MFYCTLKIFLHNNLEKFTLSEQLTYNNKIHQKLNIHVQKDSIAFENKIPYQSNIHLVHFLCQLHQAHANSIATNHKTIAFRQPGQHVH